MYKYLIKELFMEIAYLEIKDDIEEKLFKSYDQNWIKKYNCLPKYQGCYNIAALYNNEVIGCATLGPQRWTSPLNAYCDVFIHWIDVKEPFRRKGIGKNLVKLLEKWAKENGYRQIRAWSSENAVEALHMWYSLDYAMCPASEIIKNSDGKVELIVKGYRYAKILNTKLENTKNFLNNELIPKAWG